MPASFFASFGSIAFKDRLIWVRPDFAKVSTNCSVKRVPFVPKEISFIFGDDPLFCYHNKGPFKR